MVNENNVAQSDHVDFARGTGGTYGGNNGTFIPYDPNAAYYKKVIQPVLSPTEALYGPAKESIKRQYTRRFHDTSQVLTDFVDNGINCTLHARPAGITF